MREDLKEYFIFMVKYNRVLRTEGERKEFATLVFGHMLEDESVHPAIKQRLMPILARHMEVQHGC